MLGLVVVSLLATVVGSVLALVIDWFPVQASTAADDIDLLYDVLMVASVPVFVLVMAVVIYSVLAFRVEPDDLSDGAPIHGNTTLEIVWVTIPFIMVSLVAAYGWVVLDDIEAAQPDPLIVDVTGQQFAWKYRYPEQGFRSDTLVLAKDRPVEFNINTGDVLHDFWVPEFRLKSDAVPGITTKIRVTPNRIGTYDVVCAELCGIGHSTMRGSVRVVSPGSYETWATERKSRQEEQDSGADAGGDPAGADAAAPVGYLPGVLGGRG